MDDTAPLKRILLVDDEAFVAIAYRTALERSGFTVSVARDGVEALELLRQSAPDIVLLDIIMPKVDGFEVLQAMRHDPLLARVPVVVLTNLSQASDEAQARRYGANDFITKSDITLNELTLRLRQLLDDLEPAR